MSYDDNPYYQPEKHGLKKVFETDFSDGCYQFDYRVIWLHEASRRYYTARDSGCSCPSPFEDYGGIETLQHVNEQVLDELLAEVRREAGERRDYQPGDDPTDLEALRPMVRQVPA